MKLDVRQAYIRYCKACEEGGWMPIAAKRFHTVDQIEAAIVGLKAPRDDGEQAAKKVVEKPPTAPEPMSLLKKETQALSAAQRAKLRRLQTSGAIEHCWGDKWDIKDALAALAEHSYDQEKERIRRKSGK